MWVVHWVCSCSCPGGLGFASVRGIAATNAVVGGIVAIAVSDGLLAVVCYIFGI